MNAWSRKTALVTSAITTGALVAACGAGDSREEEGGSASDVGITEDTITIGDVTFIFVGAADAGIDSDTTDDDDDDTGTAPGAGDGTGTPTLPDTATGSPLSPVVLGTILVVAAAIAASATRRGEVSLR